MPLLCPAPLPLSLCLYPTPHLGVPHALPDPVATVPDLTERLHHLSYPSTNVGGKRYSFPLISVKKIEIFK